MNAGEPSMHDPSGSSPAAPSLALVAMPGAGKSTLGRVLARHLDLPFRDADHEIERRIGTSIRAFFEEQGEPAFRDIEQEVIASLSTQGPMVLATGGGAVLRESNRQVLRERFTVVYLRTSAEELARRLRHDRNRPLLQVDNPLRRLRELHRQRDPLYREVAHYVIETGRPSVHALAALVLMQLELAGVTASWPASPKT